MSATLSFDSLALPLPAKSKDYRIAMAVIMHKGSVQTYDMDPVKVPAEGSGGRLLKAKRILATSTLILTTQTSGTGPSPGTRERGKTHMLSLCSKANSQVVLKRAYKVDAILSWLPDREKKISGRSCLVSGLWFVLTGKEEEMGEALVRGANELPPLSVLHSFALGLF